MSKKMIAVLLTVCILLASGIGLMGASAATISTPVVYIQGMGGLLYADKNDASSELIWPVAVPENYISEKVSEGLPMIAKAVVTNQWDEYSDALYSWVAPLYEKVTLDDNGEASNGSGNICLNDIDWLTNRKTNGGYALEAYNFWYDWRIDLYDTAELLNRYIQRIKSVTGFEKINVVCRCLGVNAVLAYLEEYGSNDINAISFYSGGFDGMAIIGGLFSGNFEIDSNGLERYALALDDGTLDEILRSFIVVANKLGGLGLLTDGIEKIVDTVFKNIWPRILRASYSTFTSFYSMVNSECWEDAIKTNMPDIQKNAVAINHINRYYNDVYLKTDEIIDEAVNNGVKIQIVCKYGIQMAPVVKNANLNGDGTVEVYSCSYGATSAPINTTLSKDYIAEVKARGDEKYLSPDNQIDASTCRFPNTTWFVKGCIHQDMANSIHDIIVAFFASDGNLTVNDNEALPQFMLYDETTGNILPLTEENSVTEEKWNVNFWDSLLVIWKYISNLFFVFIESLDKVFLPA